MPSERADRLESWKEIAAFTRRSVRTVRRWEREEGLPVHRHQHRKLGSVYAFASEIEAWRETHARAPEPRRAADPLALSALDPIALSALDPIALRALDPIALRAQSIAVLPFANLSADPENAFFAAGLTDEVTAGLSKVRALRVTSRTSAMTFRGTTKDLRTIAGELGVRHVLEGSVRRAGNRLRITVELIDAGADAHLWADTYDGTVEDVFAIQASVARRIVESLALHLSPEEERRLDERPIADAQAYACYLRARQEGWRWQKDAIDHAVQLLHNGLELVGENARLQAALGLAYLQYREAGIDLSDGPLLAAEASARSVFALEPASSAGLLLRGWIHYSRSRIQDAVRDLKAAHALDPNDADTLLLLSNCYLISGRGAHARPLIERLLAIDPLTPLTRCMPAWADVLDGKLRAAIAPYRRMSEMDPANPMARLFYVWVLVLNRRADDAAEILDTFPEETRETVPARIAAFLVHALAGHPRKAQAALTPEIEAIAGASDLFPRLLAQGFVLAGKPERALDWLEVAVARGFIHHPYLARHDPFCGELRGQPRWTTLLETVHRRWEAFEA